ncbi:MAG: DUF3467 domain-containing protein [Planctomycetes bacterium]|nr:DUF3467 domain-containing protein [Planctomycetota bacterium]
MSDELRMPDGSNPAAAGQQAQQAPQQFVTDASEISTVYTNFCRVNMTPEELVLDFGLNTSMIPNPNETIKLSHRVVMNFFTAKRLLLALMNVVQQHENAFGALELDFQKRARGGRPVMQPQPGIKS